METVFLFTQSDFYFDAFYDSLKQDKALEISIRGKCLTVQVKVVESVVRSEAGGLEAHTLPPNAFCQFEEEKETDQYFAIDLPPENLDPIKAQISYKEIYALTYNNPRLLNYLIRNHFEESLYLNPFHHRLYTIGFLKQLLEDGKEIHIYSDDILSPPDYN